MPRSSLADRLDRASLSRGSAGKGSLGRYSIATDVSGSGSVSTRHWVNSVSDIYGPDEIEELLEDLNRLELAAFETDDIQDFDIDGSQVGHESGMAGAVAAGRFHSQYRRRSRHRPHPYQAPHPMHNPAASPTFSVRSWDSHARYQSRFDDEYDGVEVGPPPSELIDAGAVRATLHQSPPAHEERISPRDDLEGGYARSAGDGGLESHSGGVRMTEDLDIFPSRSRKSILCYCDTSTLRSPKTILRVILVLSSIACLSVVLTSGSTSTAKAGLFALPHLPRLRLMMFICIFTILFTAFVLFLYISHLIAVMPSEIAKMQTVAYLLLTIAFSVASYLLLQVHATAAASSALGSGEQDTFWTKNHLLIAAILGFLCSFETFLCIWNCGRRQPGHDKMLPLQESSTHFTLQETNLSTKGVAGGGGGGAAPPGEDEPREPAQKASNLGVKSKKPPQSQSQQQYLVNENFTQSSAAKYNHPPSSSSPPQAPAAAPSILPSLPPPPSTALSKGSSSEKPSQSRTHAQSNGSGHTKLGPSTTKAVVEGSSSSTTTCDKSTGAIPKQQQQQAKKVQQRPQQSPNPLDEIIAVPLDEDEAVAVGGRPEWPATTN